MKNIKKFSKLELNTLSEIKGGNSTDLMSKITKTDFSDVARALRPCSDYVTSISEGYISNPGNSDTSN